MALLPGKSFVVFEADFKSAHYYPEVQMLVYFLFCTIDISVFV